MSSKLYIETGIGELRCAGVQNGKARSISLFRDQEPETIGTIYLARVISASRDSDLFLDLGAGLRAHMSQRRAKAGGNDFPIEGALILVQIIREADEGKMAEASTRIRLAGRYVVLDQRLMDRPILRTVSSQIDATIWQAEFERLKQAIKQMIQPGLDAPCCLIPAPRPLSRIMQDYVPSDCTKILIDDPATLKEAQKVAQYWPDILALLRYETPSPPFFERDNIAEDLSAVVAGHISLSQGAWLNISHTPALTAIDVNAGSMPDTGDAARLQVNVSAAKEIARQIILQNIGGLIVIDFIDVGQKGAVQKTLDALDKALKHDKNNWRRTGFSEFGLVQLNRARSGPALGEKLRTRPVAPRLSLDASGYDALLRAKHLGLSPQPGRIIITTDVRLHAWLTQHPELLQRCEEMTMRRIELKVKENALEADIYISKEVEP